MIKKVQNLIVLILVFTALPTFVSAQLEVACPPSPATDCPTTLEATDRTSTKVRLGGQFEIKGSKPTSGYFRYTDSFPPPVFCKEIYGSDMVATSENCLGRVNGPKQRNQGVSELAPDTLYSFFATC